MLNYTATNTFLPQAAAQLLFSQAPTASPSLTTGNLHLCRKGNQKQMLFLTRGYQNKDIYPEFSNLLEHSLAFRHYTFHSLVFQQALLLLLHKTMLRLCFSYTGNAGRYPSSSKSLNLFFLA